MVGDVWEGKVLEVWKETIVPLDRQGRVAPDDLEHCEALRLGLIADIAHLRTVIKYPAPGVDAQELARLRGKLAMKHRLNGKLKVLARELRVKRHIDAQTALSEEARARRLVARTDAIASLPPSDRLLREAQEMLGLLIKRKSFTPNERQQEVLDQMKAYLRTAVRGDKPKAFLLEAEPEERPS